MISMVMLSTKSLKDRTPEWDIQILSLKVVLKRNDYI